MTTSFCPECHRAIFHAPDHAFGCSGHPLIRLQDKVNGKDSTGKAQDLKRFIAPDRT